MGQSNEAEMLRVVLECLEYAEEPVRLDDLPQCVCDWWAEQKAAEAANKQRVREVRDAALKKLTPEERRALGLES